MISLIKAISNPISAIGNIVDEVYTSEEEKLSKAEVMLKLNQKPHLAQSEINKIEAQHRSIFVAGWRPFIGWICGVNLLYLVCLRDWISWAVTIFGLDIEPPPPIGIDITIELVIALLGLGSLRTFEKLQGRSK